MMHRIWQKTAASLFAAVFLGVGNALAVSLEKIDVSSHLGEKLYAEIPLHLESNELISKVFVEIASPSDYKIFEVYRDPVIQTIRADVASDTRGVRVELSSRSTIQSPFFNVVLKIRYGRVSHFKKFPVFMDAKKSIQKMAEQAPQPSVQAVDVAPDHQADVAAVPAQTALTATAGQTVIPAQPVVAKTNKKPAPVYFDGWARTNRYGPIVRGDTLSIVADRLRVDTRYNLNQIMVGLYDKNTSSFNRDNMNLIKAGSYLDVPTAAEVEKNSKAEAFRRISEQEKAWKELTKQPRYAVEAEVQRNRYKKHVSMGEQAAGTTSAPVTPADAATDNSKPVEQSPASGVTDLLKTDQLKAKEALPDDTASKAVVATVPPEVTQVIQAQSKTNQLLTQLQQKNEQLQQQMLKNQKSFESLNQKMDSVTGAASEARLEKLEILMTRIQAELEKTRLQSPSPVSSGMDWAVLLLIGLVIILLGIVVILMRREPAHPAAVEVGSDHEQVHEQPAVAGSTDSKDLEAAIEDEMADLEVAEPELTAADQESSSDMATVDSMPSFNDELSDTDTAELDPYDADTSADIKPDPKVDYLSEAEVYIRYGMHDEAMQQLDMALRLQPDHVGAYRKKAELLQEKKDQQGLAVLIEAAALSLTSADLKQLRSSIGDIGSVPVEDASVAAMADTQASETIVLDDTEVEGIDFGAGERADSSQDQADADQFDAEEGMDWLQDAAFDDALPEPQLDALNVADDHAAEEPAFDDSLELAHGATQELDNLLNEFSESDDNEAADQPLGATQHIDMLLGDLEKETADKPDQTMAVSNREPETVDDSEQPMGATQHLDMLLGEFDVDDDDLDFTTTETGIDAGIIEQGKADVAMAADASLAIDADQLATQELDSLLAEFSGDDLSAGQDDAEALAEQTSGELDVDFGATQELDSLLGEFSNVDGGELDLDAGPTGLDTANLEPVKAEEATEAWEDLEHGATQVLGHLLDEFNDDFNDEDDKKA